MNVPLIFRKSQVMGQFRLHRLKGMSDTAALHIVCNEGFNLCSRKLAINQMGGKIVMSHKTGVFLYSPAGLAHAMEIVPVDLMVLTHSFFAYSICYLTIRGY